MIRDEWRDFVSNERGKKSNKVRVLPICTVTNRQDQSDSILDEQQLGPAIRVYSSIAQGFYTEMYTSKYWNIGTCGCNNVTRIKSNGHEFAQDCAHTRHYVISTYGSSSIRQLCRVTG